MQTPLTIILILLLCAGGIALLVDSRQRRLDRRVAGAMPESNLAYRPSIRRQQVNSRWRYLHYVVGYKPGITYDIRPEFVVLTGVALAIAILYVNTYFEYPSSYVFPAAIGAGVMVVRSLFRWQRRQFSDKLFRQLPDTIQLVTSTIRAGSLVSDAFRNIARDMPQPTAGQFAIVCSELETGRPAEEALENVYRRTDVAEYGMFAVTLAVQMKAGGNLGETLQTLGDTVRERVILAGRARAIAAEVIFSGKALSVAPLLVGGLMYWINRDTIDLLFTDPTGHILLTYAVCSVTLGTLVIRWMIRKDTAL